MNPSKNDLLIAIGATVGANCIPCIETLVSKAHEYGVDEAEIRHAIHLGRKVRQRAASKWDDAVVELLGKRAAPVAAVAECPFS